MDILFSLSKEEVESMTKKQNDLWIIPLTCTQWKAEWLFQWKDIEELRINYLISPFQRGAAILIPKSTTKGVCPQFKSLSKLPITLKVYIYAKNSMMDTNIEATK